MVKAEEIEGYKAFNKDHTNRYQKLFEEGKIFRIPENKHLKFGVDGCGYHFCKRLEDTLRYFPALEEEIAIASVTSIGEVVESFDDYNGYYDMYTARELKINHFLERKEIIDIFLEMPVSSLSSPRLERFLSQFKLTSDELMLFKEKCQGISRLENTIGWYQENDKEAFNIDAKQKVKSYNNS